MFEKLGKYIGTAFVNSMDSEEPFEFIAIITIALFLFIVVGLVVFNIFGAYTFWIIPCAAFVYLWQNGTFIERE